MRHRNRGRPESRRGISIHAPREGCDSKTDEEYYTELEFQSTHPARGATVLLWCLPADRLISIHAPREGCDHADGHVTVNKTPFQSTHPARGATSRAACRRAGALNFNPRTPRGVRHVKGFHRYKVRNDFNPRTPRGVRQQTLPKSREFAWLNLLICTRGRRLSIQKQTRLCSIKLSFMLFGCEPAGEGVSSWTSHATKSKVRLEGRSA